MSGLELIARDSKSEIEKNAEAAAVYFAEVYNKDDDERNWSFSYLREQLNLKNSQELFRRYQVRVQHALFVELLFFNLAYNAISLAAYIFLPDENSEHMTDVSLGAVQTGRWCRSVILLIQFCIFVAAYKESLFRSANAKIAAASVVLACMMAGETATTLYRLGRGFQEPTMRQTFYVILTTSVLLPFPRKLYSGMSGAAVIAIDLALSTLSSGNQKKLRVVCYCDIGDYYAVTMKKLARQRQKLCFSVISRDIVRRCRVLPDHAAGRPVHPVPDRGDEQEGLPGQERVRGVQDQDRDGEEPGGEVPPEHPAHPHRQRGARRPPEGHQGHGRAQIFQKLYVKTYKGVSILYADIVNSMLLAASLKVSDLVATLNDLFGRFDESAEVSSNPFA
ncbi:AC_N domain-containing protein [Caerostris extrusa]|uniref:AC_N domain-containing protein n=1 Tax=Caerostris extrusa TaxID=172846 RepID=A0AAV4U0B4_CAEEX|nr:AC_N domain-containing protein [Caerostris extrusa]